MRVLGKLALSDPEAAENHDDWLWVRTVDGIDGWVNGREFDLKPSVLSALPELSLEAMSALVRAGARMYAQPQIDDTWREVPADAVGWLEGQSPDGDWLLAHSVAEVDDQRHGWIAVTDLHAQPIHSQLPIVFASGLWLVPLDEALTAIQVLPNVAEDSWGWGGLDGIIYLDDDDPYDRRSGTLRRFSLTFRQTGNLTEGVSGRISVSPGGDDVIVLPYGPVNAHRQPMTLVRDGGVAQQLGSQNTLGMPIPSLRERIRWSDHGPSLLSIDRLAPMGSGSEFPVTLHYLDGRGDIDLGLASDAIFDADGRSVWLVYGGNLARVESSGREHVVALPLPALNTLEPYPVDGMVTVIVGEGNRQALLVGRRGAVERSWAADRVIWAPDGVRYAYRTVQGWYVADLRRGQLVWLGSTVLDVCWSPDGRHLALLMRPHRSDGIVSLTPSFAQLRIHAADGTLVAAHRVASCAQIAWSPDSRVLAIGAVWCSGA